MSRAEGSGTTSVEALAVLLDGHDDYRVLRRLRPMSRFGGPEARAGTSFAGCVLDVETTGLDHRRHAVIELAMQRFRADGTGRIVDVGPSFRWLEDPGVPIPPAALVVLIVAHVVDAERRVRLVQGPRDPERPLRHWCPPGFGERDGEGEGGSGEAFG